MTHKRSNIRNGIVPIGAGLVGTNYLVDSTSRWVNIVLKLCGCQINRTNHARSTSYVDVVRNNGSGSFTELRVSPTFVTNFQTRITECPPRVVSKIRWIHHRLACAGVGCSDLAIIRHLQFAGRF